MGLDEVLQAGEANRYLGWAPSVRVSHQPFQCDSEANVLPSSSHLEFSNMLPWHGPGSGSDDIGHSKCTLHPCISSLHSVPPMTNPMTFFMTWFPFINNEVVLTKCPLEFFPFPAS